MMISLNQRIFEEVLEPMFPGEFAYQHMSRNIIPEMMIGDPYIQGYKPDKSLIDAFWLAEKVGLFDPYRDRDTVLTKTDNGYWEIRHEKELIVEHFMEETISEVICQAILAIYGKKK